MAVPPGSLQRLPLKIRVCLQETDRPQLMEKYVAPEPIDRTQAQCSAVPGLRLAVGVLWLGEAQPRRTTVPCLSPACQLC